MKTLSNSKLVSIEGGSRTGWWFACGAGVVLSASLIGGLMFGPSTAAICYCAASGDC